jgi:magnesium-protoporphyrin IX monomethyl ester (oxidative) cyclase
VIGRVKRLGLTAAAAATFVRLYLLPVRRNQATVSARLQPVW